MLIKRAKGFSADRLDEALMCAVDMGQGNVLDMLLRKEIFSCDQLGEALCQAARKGHETIAETLIELRKSRLEHRMGGPPPLDERGTNYHVANASERKHVSSRYEHDAFKFAATMWHVGIVRMLLPHVAPGLDIASSLVSGLAHLMHHYTSLERMLEAGIPIIPGVSLPKLVSATASQDLIAKQNEPVRSRCHLEFLHALEAIREAMAGRPRELAILWLYCPLQQMARAICFLIAPVRFPEDLYCYRRHDYGGFRQDDCSDCLFKIYEGIDMALARRKSAAA